MWPVNEGNAFIPVATGQIIEISAENAHEHADLIGKPLADAIADSKPMPNRYMRLIESPTRTCRFCMRTMRDDESFFGPVMWHRMIPTCKHAIYYSCPTCFKDDSIQQVCATCGCGEFYT